MRLRSPYDESYSPPAPLALVAVSAPGSTQSTVIPMLIDTGADASVLPAALVRVLRLPQVDIVQVGGPTAAPLRATVHAATLRFGSAEQLAEIVAIGEEPLLGRDLLQRMITRLDGPGSALSLTMPAAPRRKRR